MTCNRSFSCQARFAGKDPFNIAGTLRAVPEHLPVIGAQLHSAADSIENATQDIFSAVAEDTGNYTDEFTRRFEDLVGGDPQVALLDPTWDRTEPSFCTCRPGGALV